jgi:hypothetical protein
MGEITSTRGSQAYAGPWSTRPSTHVDLSVRVLRAIHGLLIGLVFFVMALLLLATGGLPRYTLATWACATLGLGVLILNYFGLRLRKAWLVPLVVMWSVYYVVGSIFRGEPNSLPDVVVVRAMSVLALYQLWFFTRSGTRAAFGADGTIVL